MGLEPTGRRMRIDEVYFFRIADDRIAALWTRMRQLQGRHDHLGELGSLG
jgi:predicted ester cyclase